VETLDNRLHRLWNKLAALSININVLQEYLPTVDSLKTVAKQLIESGDSGPLQDATTPLRKISLDGFYNDLTSLVHESSACIEELKQELAQVEAEIQDGQSTPKEGNS
jgi:hypothetical protein